MSAPRHLLRVQCISCAAGLFLGQKLILSASARLQTSASPHIHSQLLRAFHRSAASTKNHRNQTGLDGAVEDVTQHKEKTLTTHDALFERVTGDLKSQDDFNRVLEVFKSKDIRRRGHVEFIYAALKKMPEFGVERKLEVYNKLLDVFPKEVFVPHNFIQRMFNHYPRQQECGVQVLEQMESYGVMPNVDTKVILAQIFGEKSHPVKKLRRIMYWFPKFKHANPYPIPHVLPNDPVELAKFSLARIAADLDAEITVYQYPSTDFTESGEKITHPHIVGIQSPDQRSLLAKHNTSKPVFVEGPFPLWLRKTCVHYFLLRADPVPPGEKMEEELDPELICPEQSLFFPRRLDLNLDVDLGEDFSFDVDDVEEGAVYGMCMAGQSDQATLSQWISGLQETCPILGQIPTVFRLETGPRELQPSAEAQSFEQEEDCDQNREEENEPLRSKGVKQ